ncbi:MAG: AMP-binding protein [Eubacteriales bacterium]|nr:AMP-binding protein [Eubacteriales bacterium]
MPDNNYWEKPDRFKRFINKKKDYPFYTHCPYVYSVRELLDVCSARYGEKAAWMFREDGEIKSVTFNAFRDEVNSLGTGFCEYGIQNRHTVIIGNNCYNWALSFYAVLASEGVAVPTDSALRQDELEYIFTFSDSTVIIYSKSMEKTILELEPRLASITHFICMEEPEAKDDRHFSLRDIKSKGRELYQSGDTRYTGIVPDPERLSELVFTSGTTGKAKGVMLNQRAICHVVSHSPDIMHVTYSCMSVLPYYHTLESTCGILGMFHSGNTNCINESLRTLMPNIKLYKPTDIQLVPLFVEKMYRSIRNKIEEQGKTEKVKKAIRLSDALLKLGIDIRQKLFKDIHSTFGGQLVVIICGGAPLAPEIAEFFYSIGITVCTGYGITECAPIITITRPEFHDYRSVGTIMPGVSVRIDKPDENGEGEICVKAPNVMMGYYKDEERTNQVIDGDGWFHTGDIGSFYKDNRLCVTGRLKNVIILPNGKNVYPEELEYRLHMMSDLISEIIVCEMEKNGESVIGAEIFPDISYAAANGITDIEGEIKRVISEYNKGQPNHKVIKEAKIRDTEFDKTTSAKIKRDYSKLNRG